MDNFSAQGSNQLVDKPLIYTEKDPVVYFSRIKNFFNRKIVKAILVLITLFAVGIPAGLLVNQKYTEKKKITSNYQKEEQRRLSLENFKIGETGIFGFYGKTNKIEGEKIFLETKDGQKIIQTKKDTLYLELPLVLDEKAESKVLKNPIVKSNYSRINEEDLLYIMGTDSVSYVSAEQIWIYKIP